MYSFWALVTRFGEAQILLPAAVLTLLWLVRRDDGRLPVVWWVAMLTLAVLFTTASKIAFIGYGLGIASINFTGVSGHAMFAAVVYPLLLGTLTSTCSLRAQRLALLAAYAFAFLVGTSRWMIGVHTASEVVAGWLVGGAASAAAVLLARLPHSAIGLGVPVLLALWLAIMPLNAPPSRTHDWVTRLSLQLSGRDLPYTRAEMMREWRLRRAVTL